jgi:hypothetical protein
MSYYPPTSEGYGAPQTPPSNNLVWAILTTIFCCLPAGVVSIVFAAQVDGKWRSGDYQGAYSSAKNAKTWAIVSAVLGVISILVFGLIGVLGALSENSGTTY